MITVKRGHIFELHNRIFFKFADFQWQMLLALPLLLLYNGKKGFRLKYFFYFFYPTHIIILYFIGKNLH
ncbi:TraX family protein [Cytobacillus praedii]|uniref:TraX family protein n=1 Tax=Cytobacillus praedii TaxID=1742358 RepID=UPI00399D4273